MDGGTKETNHGQLGNSLWCLISLYGQYAVICIKLTVFGHAHILVLFQVQLEDCIVIVTSLLI